MQENWDLILKRWGTEMLLTHFIRDIITPVSDQRSHARVRVHIWKNSSDHAHLLCLQFCSDAMANEAEAFFGGDDALPSIALSLKQSLEKVRIKARWVEHIKEETQLLVALVEKLATK